MTSRPWTDPRAPECLMAPIRPGRHGCRRRRAARHGARHRSADGAPHRRPGAARGDPRCWALGERGLDKGFRTVQCDLRWAATGSAGLAPFDHRVVAADHVAVLDACGLAEVDVVAIGSGVPQALALAALAPERGAARPPRPARHRCGPDVGRPGRVVRRGDAVRPRARFRGPGEGARRRSAQAARPVPTGSSSPPAPSSSRPCPGWGASATSPGWSPSVTASTPTARSSRVTADEVADHPRPLLVVPHPDRTASADEVVAALPRATRGLPGLTHAPATWRTVSQRLSASTAP